MLSFSQSIVAEKVPTGDDARALLTMGGVQVGAAVDLGVVGHYARRGVRWDDQASVGAGG